MDLEDTNENSVSKRGNLMEPQCLDKGKDIFQDMLSQSLELRVEEDKRSVVIRNGRKQLKKFDMRKILNSSSSNERLPSSLKNDSSSLEHSDRPRNMFETQNSMDEQSFRKSFKKRYQESFSVENTIRDSSSSFSERSDSKSNQNQNILQSVYKEQEIQEPKKSGCNCKRSRCLKLYCQCFQKQLFCNENCNCHSCGNHVENVAEHKQAVIEALARNAHGFDDEESRDHKQSVQQKGFSLGVEIQEVKKGCKCRKTHCVKKYCQCYHNGGMCGIFCRCQDCHNTAFHQKK